MFNWAEETHAFRQSKQVEQLKTHVYQVRLQRFELVPALNFILTHEIRRLLRTASEANCIGWLIILVLKRVRILSCNKLLEFLLNELMLVFLCLKLSKNVGEMLNVLYV